MKAVHEAAVPHAGPHNVRAWWQAWLHYRAEGSWHGRKRRRHRRGQGCTSALSLLASRQAAARMDAGVAAIPHTWLHATSGTVGGKVPLSRAGVQATARTWLGAKVHTARKAAGNYAHCCWKGCSTARKVVGPGAHGGWQWCGQRGQGCCPCRSSAHMAATTAAQAPHMVWRVATHAARMIARMAHMTRRWLHSRAQGYVPRRTFRASGRTNPRNVACMAAHAAPLAALALARLRALLHTAPQVACMAACATPIASSSRARFRDFPEEPRKRLQARLHRRAQGCVAWSTCTAHECTTASKFAGTASHASILVAGMAAHATGFSAHGSRKVARIAATSIPGLVRRAHSRTHVAHTWVLSWPHGPCKRGSFATFGCTRGTDCCTRQGHARTT